jgi:hypothetical protein
MLPCRLDTATAAGGKGLPSSFMIDRSVELSNPDRSRPGSPRRKPTRKGRRWPSGCEIREEAKAHAVMVLIGASVSRDGQEGVAAHSITLSERWLTSWWCSPTRNAMEPLKPRNVEIPDEQSKGRASAESSCVNFHVSLSWFPRLERWNQRVLLGREKPWEGLSRVR